MRYNAVRMENPDMVNQKEAAAIVGVSIGTFRRRLADGTISLPHPALSPYLKRPRKILYYRADVERLAQPRKEG